MRSGTGPEPNVDQNHSRIPICIYFLTILECILASVWVLKFDRFFCCFFEKALFATLGAIREAMGAKVVPKGSQKESKRDNFVGRVDF